MFNKNIYYILLISGVVPKKNIIQEYRINSL